MTTKKTINKKQAVKWIVWSLDCGESQVLTDIVEAKTETEAIRKVERKRGDDAVIDSMVPAMPLADYIEKLRRHL